MSKIITHYVYPPIPCQSHDWVAYFEGEEETGRNGFGSTKQEAIDNLKQYYEDFELEIPK